MVRAATMAMTQDSVVNGCQLTPEPPGQRRWCEKLLHRGVPGGGGYRSTRCVIGGTRPRLSHPPANSSRYQRTVFSYYGVLYSILRRYRGGSLSMTRTLVLMDDVMLIKSYFSKEPLCMSLAWQVRHPFEHSYAATTTPYYCGDGEAFAFCCARWDRRCSHSI